MLAAAHPLPRQPRPDDIVRVRVQAEERFVGPLWGLYFGENNLSEVVSREFAELTIRRSGSSDSYRLLQLVEVNQDTGEPLDEQPEIEPVESLRLQPIDLGERRQEIERRKPPVPDRGVPSEPIPDKKRPVVRLPIGLAAVPPPAAPPIPPLAAALLDDEPFDSPPTAAKAAEPPNNETGTAPPVSSVVAAPKGRRAPRYV